MKNRIQSQFIALVLLAVLIAQVQFSTACAQGTTAFTYQGQLRDNGTNANGAYTMIFKLYDSLSGGNQIGSAITAGPTLANGLFTVNLDFGAGAFNGSARYLDITITNGGVTQELSPRVQVLPSPYALYAAVAATVTNGAIMNAQLAANAVNANNIASGQVVKSLNGLMDAISLIAGTNVTITPSVNTLQISASGGGGGGGVTVTNTLAAGNNVGLFTNSGIVEISSFVPSFQVFRSVTNAIFTVPTNVTKIMVEMWGAGGGGGASDTSYSYIGGGGGGGAYAWSTFTVTNGTSYAVTAGAGGSGGITGGANGSTGATSSFGTLMSAGGGSGGMNSDTSGNAPNGQGGTATGGILNVSGSGGQTGGQSGGLGGGIWRGSSNGFQGGGGGSGPGGGGGGGSPNPSQSSGSAGRSGLVIVYY
jgi:hypothetical protein